MKDNICDYDEAYNRNDAEDIGWCKNCKIKECPKNKSDKKNGNRCNNLSA